jgi:serine protease
VSGQILAVSASDTDGSILKDKVGMTVAVQNGLGYGYASWDGTSMASPHVAGVAALVWSHHPDKTNDQIRTALKRM